MSADAASSVRLRHLRRIVGSLWVRVLVTAGLMGLVASRIDWATVGSRLGHGHPADFAVALALVLCSLVIGMTRWRYLLKGAGVELGVARVARVYTIAEFSGTFLPATVGGDVTRTLLIARRGPTLIRVIVSVVVDRAGGLMGLIGMAWLAYVLRPSAVPGHALAFLLWVTVALLVALVFVAVIITRGSTIMRRLTPRRMVSHAREFRSLLHEYLLNPPLILLVACTSLAFQALVALQLVFLGKAIDVHLPFATAAVSLALVTIATLVPISIGGFGVREGTYVLLLGSASIGPTDATLISVLSVATLFLASLPGAFFLARGGLVPVPVEGAI